MHRVPRPADQAPAGEQAAADGAPAGDLAHVRGEVDLGAGRGESGETGETGERGESGETEETGETGERGPAAPKKEEDIKSQGSPYREPGDGQNIFKPR